MAIVWSDESRPRVAGLLERFPVTSARCADLANQLRPIAIDHDVNSKIWRLEPSEGRYLVPNLPFEVQWRFHVTTETAAHYVDAITGTDGTACGAYLAAHWTQPDTIVWIERTP